MPAHNAEIISFSKAQNRLGKFRNGVSYKRYVASLDRDDAPERHGRSTRREGNKRFAKGPAIESIRTRGYRLLKGEACQVGQSHPSVGIRCCRTAVSGDCGAPGREVLLLRCYAACTILSSIGRAGEPGPAPSARALPHLQGDAHTPQVESGAPIHASRHLRMDIVIEVGTLRDATASEYGDEAILLDVIWTHKRGSTCEQAAVTETDQLLPLLRRASAITTLVRDRCP